MDNRLDRLKEQISSLPKSRNGKRLGVTDELRRTVVVAFENSRFTANEFSSQIGVSCSSLNKWIHDFRSTAPSSKNKPTAQFRKIEVTPTQQIESEYEKHALMIEGPRGLKVSGMNVSDLTLLWRSLC